ncbi:hypothetical protein N7474_009841 [Penicillium riverlandense]|uniref:uncharacterized protein n=1 Tax=Penicillium riverlandense TaxID=1903569 RepID=UPI002547E4FA|nr:uncharacterized protein N7474_009841 [Penicillium riverlandense]KAJ5808572.1 hypothetical protein N7474_009841 [Penicillium riverlandense]
MTQPPAKRSRPLRSQRKRYVSPMDIAETKHQELVSSHTEGGAKRSLSDVEAGQSANALREELHRPDSVANIPMTRSRKALVPNFSTPTRDPRPKVYMSIQHPQAAAKMNQKELQSADDSSGTHKDGILQQTGHLGCLLWPKVGFGDEAPYPRWLVTKNPEINGSSGLFETQILSEQLSSVVSSSSSKTNLDGGLHGLIWVFDAGPSSGWNNLKKDQLYEYAYKCLEDALGNPSSREHFRFAVTNLFPTFITNVSDSLPLMPTAPKTCYLGTQPGLHEIIEAPTNLDHATYYFAKYSRPVMAVSLARPGLHARESHLQTMAIKMFHNMKGTLAPLITESEPDEMSILNVNSTASQSTDQSGPCSQFGEQYDPETVQDVPLTGQLSSLPPDDGGIIAQTDEYLYRQHCSTEDDGSLLNSPLTDVETPAELTIQDHHFGLFSPNQVAGYYPDRGQYARGNSLSKLVRNTTDPQPNPVPPQATKATNRQNHGESRAQQGTQDDNDDEDLQRALETSLQKDIQEKNDPPLPPPPNTDKNPRPGSEVLRRIRTWAGSTIPPAVADQLKVRVSHWPTSYRSFNPFPTPQPPQDTRPKSLLNQESPRKQGPEGRTG